MDQSLTSERMPLPSSDTKLQSYLNVGLQPTERQAMGCPQDTLVICGFGIQWPGDTRTASDFRKWLQQQDEDKNGTLERVERNCNLREPRRCGSNGNEGHLGFDTGFCSMNDTDTTSIATHQGHLLQVLHECLEDAGETRHGNRGAHVGCYVALNYFDGATRSFPGVDTTASLISKVFGITSMHCTNEAEAVHRACEAVQNGACRGALVACQRHVGDQLSNGSTDIISAIYIKGRENANEDGNPIQATIKKQSSRGLSNQGRSGTHNVSCLISNDTGTVSHDDFQ